MAAEHQQVTAELRNRHTFFFIPLQYAALGLAGIGVILLVVGAAAAVMR